MYELFSRVSAWLSEPFAKIAYNTDIAILAALFLGFVGSVAPCQISANLGSITYFGNRMIQQKKSLAEVFFYLLGKVMVYSFFGFLFWCFGRNISNESIPLFVFARKMEGPLFILIGFFLLGLIQLPGNIGFQLSRSMERFSRRLGGKSSAFALGVAFSLGFCPTMVWLFFGALMPLVMESSAGLILPPIFAVGTAFPLLLFLGLYVGFGLDRVMVKKAKRWGGMIQKAAGILLSVLGIADTITYWTL